MSQRLVATFPMLLVLAACNGTPPAGDAGLDTVSDDVQPVPDVTTDTGAPTLELPVTELAVDGVTLRPLSGASVVADLPTGGRAEATSGADGRVRLQGVDLSRGPVTITAWKAGYAVTTYYRATAAMLREWESLLLYPQHASTTVAVTGAVLNRTAPHVIITSTASADVFQARAATRYSMTVRTNEAFSLYAAQHAYSEEGRTIDMPIMGWARIDHAALTAPLGSLDIDFVAQRVTSIRRHVTYRLPTRTDSVLRTRAYAFFNVLSGNTPVGYINHSEVGTEPSTMSVDGEWVDTGHPLMTTHVLQDPRPPTGTSGYSRIDRTGPPVEGEVIEGFLDLPQVTRPSTPDEAAPLQDPVSWTASDTDTSGSLTLTDAANETRWVVFVANTSDTTITLPELPSAAIGADVLGTDALSGQICIRKDFDTTTSMYRRIACAQPVRLQP